MTTTTRTATRAASAAALTMTALLAISGCGSDDTKASETSSPAAEAGTGKGSQDKTWTYQFDEAKVADQDEVEPVMSESNPFTVTVSDELKKATPSVGKVMVKSYQVTAKALPSGLCRADVDVTFNSGGQDAILKRSPDDAMRWMGISRGGIEVVSTIPDNNQIGSEGGAYVTEDASKFALVDDCSEDARDNFMTLRFPFAEAISGRPDENSNWDRETVLASAYIVMVPGAQAGSGDTTTMVKGETMLNVAADGSWKKPTEAWEIEAPSDGGS